MRNIYEEAAEYFRENKSFIQFSIDFQFIFSIDFKIELYRIKLRVDLKWFDMGLEKILYIFVKINKMLASMFIRQPWLLSILQREMCLRNHKELRCCFCLLLLYSLCSDVKRFCCLRPVTRSPVCYFILQAQKPNRKL